MNWTFHWNTGQWSYQARIDDWSHTHDLFYFSLFVSALFAVRNKNLNYLPFAWLSPVFDNRLLKALREMSPPLWGYVTTSNLYYLCICYYTLPSGNIKHSFSLSLSLFFAPSAFCAITKKVSAKEGPLKTYSPVIFSSVLLFCGPVYTMILLRGIWMQLLRIVCIVPRTERTRV